MSSASFIFRFLGGDLECVAGMNGDHTTRLDPGLFASLGVVTPVRNLFIGSCWANQIGGIPGAVAAAYVAARKAK